MKKILAGVQLDGMSSPLWSHHEIIQRDGQYFLIWDRPEDGSPLLAIRLQDKDIERTKGPWGEDQIRVGLVRATPDTAVLLPVDT